MNCCGSTGTNAIEVTLKLARKNSLHFGSDEGAESAAVYHSLISTVKLQGRFAWDYLGKFLPEFLTVAEIFEFGTAKYELGCMPIVKKQSDLITFFFVRYPFWCLIKRVCSKLSIN